MSTARKLKLELVPELDSEPESEPESEDTTLRQSGIRMRTLEANPASIQPSSPETIVFESLLWTPSVKPPAS